MSLLDVLFASMCVACRGPGGLCCPTCRASLHGPAALVWPRPSPPGLPPPWTVAAYDGACRDLVLAYKERGAIGLRRVLAEPLATALIACVRAPDVRPTSGRLLAVPVPSSPRAIRERGDDVVRALARTAAARARRHGEHVTVVAGLRHGRTVSDSAGLTSQARSANLAGAFVVPGSVRPALAKATVVIVDDLMTTGASVCEAARALREAGAQVVGAATIASTRRRDADEVLGRNDHRSTVRNDRSVGAPRADRE